MASANQEENADDPLRETDNQKSEDTANQTFIENGEDSEDIENDKELL